MRAGRGARGRRGRSKPGSDRPSTQRKAMALLDKTRPSCSTAFCSTTGAKRRCFGPRHSEKRRPCWTKQGRLVRRLFVQRPEQNAGVSAREAAKRPPCWTRQGRLVVSTTGTKTAVLRLPKQAFLFRGPGFGVRRRRGPSASSPGAEDRRRAPIIGCARETPKGLHPGRPNRSERLPGKDPAEPGHTAVTGENPDTPP